MNNRINRILTAALALILVTLACGFKPPVTQIKTGTLQGVEIQVPLPEESTTGLELNLEFVAGDLKLAPGASGYLASGQATFNAVDFGPKVESTGSSYTLSQGD